MAEVRVSITHLTPTKFGNILVLKEDGGERVFALQLSHQDYIFLGLALEGRTTSHGTPYDTMKEMIIALNGTVEKVVIDEPEVRELGSDEFVATIYIRRNGRLNAVGARKVDAVALALKTKGPIFIEDVVFEKSLVLPQELPNPTTQRKSVFAWFDGLNHHLLTKH